MADPISRDDVLDASRHLQGEKRLEDFGIQLIYWALRGTCSLHGDLVMFRSTSGGVSAADTHLICPHHQDEQDNFKRRVPVMLIERISK